MSTTVAEYSMTTLDGGVPLQVGSLAATAGRVAERTGVESREAGAITARLASTFLIVKADSQHFGIPCSSVRELFQLPEVSLLPHAPEGIRGLVNVRGGCIPVLDLRTRIHLQTMASFTAEFMATMDQRAADHQAWLDELDRCVRNREEFKLSKDPTQCAFGKWYATFHTSNLQLAGAVRAFEKPHNEIHRLAVDVCRLCADGHFDEAIQMIESARKTTLARLLKLFDSIKDVIRDTHREMAVVLEGGGIRRVALAVDEVLSVEQLNLESEEARSSQQTLGNGLVRAFVRRPQQDEKEQSVLVGILDLARLSATGEIAH